MYDRMIRRTILLAGLTVGLTSCASGTDVYSSSSEDVVVRRDVDREVAPPPPVSDAEVEVDGSGLFPQPCTTDSQCVSERCLPAPDGRRVCTKRCAEDEECTNEGGAGWECLTVANYEPDAESICVVIRFLLCAPCEHDGDCGTGRDLCVEVGNSTRCARDCRETACPAGYFCSEILRENDSTSHHQCLPENGTCDPCVDEDGDGYGNEGDCLGIDCDDRRVNVYEGAPEICDGVDNDCDSLVDEPSHLVGSPAEQCESNGVCYESIVRCLGGGWVCDYPDSYEQDERSCDGLDNDCDGNVDEGLQRTCGTDQGECQSGVQFCHAGIWGDCDGHIEETLEVCDGLDNDCDGVIDENVPRDHGPDGQEHALCCRDGDWVGCDERPHPSAEACDGLDNDGDGDIDEDLRRACGTNEGECQAGVQSCHMGIWGDCEGEIGPTPEVCDGSDNDCDRDTDEQLERHCGSDIGECRIGVERCSGGQWGRCIGQIPPTNEQCDGLDNDCDGAIDEHLERACGTNAGVCRSGTERCRNGRWGACEGEVRPSEETCNGRDDDCDGRTDEGESICGHGFVGCCSQRCIPWMNLEDIVVELYDDANFGGGHRTWRLVDGTEPNFALVGWNDHTSSLRLRANTNVVIRLWDDAGPSGSYCEWVGQGPDVWVTEPVMGNIRNGRCTRTGPAWNDHASALSWRIIGPEQCPR